MSKRNGRYIYTYTGQKFYPFDPSPEDINIVDIAHALSHNCRFTGHVKRLYTVAEHSINVARQLKKQDSPYALEGLLHDASEAYLVDLPKPLKSQMEENFIFVFKKLEELIEETIAAKYHLVYGIDWPTEVKTADTRMTWTEIRDLMPKKDDWLMPDALGPYEDLKIDDGLQYNATLIKKEFLQTFQRLADERNRKGI